MNRPAKKPREIARFLMAVIDDDMTQEAAAELVGWSSSSACRYLAKHRGDQLAPDVYEHLGELRDIRDEHRAADAPEPAAPAPAPAPAPAFRVEDVQLPAEDPAATVLGRRLQTVTRDLEVASAERDYLRAENAALLRVVARLACRALGEESPC